MGVDQEQNMAGKNLFVAKLEARWAKGKFVCVGLDSDYIKIPGHVLSSVGRPNTLAKGVLAFNKVIIDATADLVCAYKPNSAFYEALGEAGWNALARTTLYLRETHPDIPVIVDAKRGDIDSTNNGYVEAIFDNLQADAVTVHPYLGRRSLLAFLNRDDKGIIVLVKTSNKESGEFQDLPVGDKKEPLYHVVARHVAETWNEKGNCGVVVGATYPKELAAVRKIVGDMPILIPGIGTQGGEVESTVRAGRDSRGWGMIINSSRGIIFASDGRDFAQAARSKALDLNEQIKRAILQFSG